MIRLGYACINETLKSQKITTNRGMVKKTFLEKGLSYCSELALQNLKDLFTIVSWNEKNSIKLFRMSSDLFPWLSEYELHELPDFKKIKTVLETTGNFANTNNIRLSFHPGPFNVLCSPDDNVVKKTIKELNQHSEIMDIMGLEKSRKHKINIHIGGVYGNKQDAIERFCVNYEKLSESTKSRLTIENDDKFNMYSVSDLLPISQRLKVPIVFDFFHYDCNPGILSKQESLQKCLETWNTSETGIIPVTHYSNSKKVYEDESAKPISHSDYLYEKIPFSELYDFDVVLESKAKELSLFKYKKDFNH